MNIVKVGYVVIITLIGLLLLFQQSTAIYWQQTYHQASPLAGLQKQPFFSSIIDINEQLLDEENYYLAQIKLWNEQVIGQYNHLLFGENLLTDNREGSNSNDELATGTNQKNALLAQSNQDKQSLADKVETTLANSQSSLSNDIDNANKSQTQSTVIIETNVTTKTNTVNTDVEIANQLSEPIQIAKALQPIVLQPQDKILFIGDSLMQGVAPRVKRALYQQYHVESVDLSKQSTGLAYPSVLNWPKTVEETLAQDPAIKLLVVFLGPNDPWDYQVKGQAKYLKFQSAQWEATYRYRINRILVAAQLNQTQVIWLGVPCMRKTTLHNNMVYLNTLYRSEVAKMNEHYIATSELLGCNDEGYANFVTTNKGNVKVRIDDGIHFTVPGQRIIAERIIDEITVGLIDQSKAAAE